MGKGFKFFYDIVATRLLLFTGLLDRMVVSFVVSDIRYLPQIAGGAHGCLIPRTMIAFLVQSPDIISLI